MGKPLVPPHEKFIFLPLLVIHRDGLEISLSAFVINYEGHVAHYGFIIHHIINIIEITDGDRSPKANV